MPERITEKPFGMWKGSEDDACLRRDLSASGGRTLSSGHMAIRPALKLDHRLYVQAVEWAKESDVTLRRIEERMKTNDRCALNTA